MVDDELPSVRPARGRGGVHRPGSPRRPRARRVPEPPPEPETESDNIESDNIEPDTIEAADAEADGLATDDFDFESVDVITDGPAIGTAVVRVPLPVAPIAEDHSWLDQDAGPVVRPYTLVGGRSRPFTSGLGLLTHVEALYAPDADLIGLQPEHRSILSLTRTALSVAELAARIDLPVGVVRVLVGDLLQANLVSTFEADAAVRAPDDDILQAVIDGLRAL